MSQTTNNVAVVSDITFEDLLDLNRTIHHKVKEACAQVGQKPTFAEDFGKCTNEDFKNVHQTLRTLISAKKKAMWEEEVKEIKAGIDSVVATHMENQRVRKARYDAITDREFLAPFPTSFNLSFILLKPAFAQGTTPEQMVIRCKELGHTVVKTGDEYALKIAFVAAPDSEAKAA